MARLDCPVDLHQLSLAHPCRLSFVRILLFTSVPSYRRPPNAFVGGTTVFSGRRYGGLNVARPKNCQESN